MKILLIAPQPFYQERGTTIAIDLMLRILSERGDCVDLLTFHLGDDRSYPGLSLRRIRPPFAPASIGTGFSWRKVYCDLFLLREAFRMVREKQYDLIHAVEEASFIAMILHKVVGVPFVFDMDSSMSAQMIDRFTWLRPAGGFLSWLETLPMRRAIAVAPMCEDLGEWARQHCGLVHILKDISLLDSETVEADEDLRTSLELGGPMLLYVGNLAAYQGIDLLLDSLVELHRTHPSTELVIIGGSDSDIQKYRRKASRLGLGSKVHLIGHRPVSALGSYLKQADLLVSPRIKGTNTPMKIYSYLDSGVASVVTALPTHTQVMSEVEAALTPADPVEMAAVIARLLESPAERRRLATNAKALISREHSWTSFSENVHALFGKIEAQL